MKHVALLLVLLAPCVAAAADPPLLPEDSYTAQGTLPPELDRVGLKGEAWFFTAANREGSPQAVMPVTIDAQGMVSGVDPHHHPGEAMITEVVLESPTFAPWWSIAWPDGKVHIGTPTLRKDAVMLHGTLFGSEDGKPLPQVRIFGNFPPEQMQLGLTISRIGTI